MYVLKARNANQALPEMLRQLQVHGDVVQRESRNGPVLVFQTPVTIQYQCPKERVVFWPERDANPFFHLFESLWMLAGRNDVAYPARFAANIRQYSDDGVTFHGAYGFRWKKHFKFDQILRVANTLKANREDRRCIVQMWDAKVDGGAGGKDYPCNLIAVFNRNLRGDLNMTVYNRSNDIVWGALGANCVHFSYLQEFIAAYIGCDVGQYWQISANMHGYRSTVEPLLHLADMAYPSKQYRARDPYEGWVTPTFPLVNTDCDTWLGDLQMFLEEGDKAMGYRDAFFKRVALPMLRAHNAFKQAEEPNRFKNAIDILHNDMALCDWKIAATEWLCRRLEKSLRKAKGLDKPAAVAQRGTDQAAAA